MNTTTTTNDVNFDSSAFRGRGRLENIVNELDRQAKTRKDFVADTRLLSFASDGTSVMMRRADGQYDVTDPAYRTLGRIGRQILPQALAQIGQKCSPAIPTRFLADMARERPEHTALMLNPFFSEPQQAEKRLVRCLDDKVRAFLSDRYRIIDNHDLAFMALGAVKEANGEVIECSLTDSHMRMKFVARDVWETINDVQKSSGEGSHTFIHQTGARRGDGPTLPGGPETVHPVVTITNSETGHGGLNVKIGILRAYCVNTAMIEDVATQVHLGKRLDEGFYQQDTIDTSNKALTLQLRDAVTAAFHPGTFRELVARVQESQKAEIAEPIKSVEYVIANSTITQDRRDDILKHFLSDYDSTAYGLAQAVSRAAQDVADVERASEMEQLAGKLMTDRALARQLVSLSA